MLIVPYYSVIGGWVIKYLFELPYRIREQVWQRTAIFPALFPMEQPQKSAFLIFTLLTVRHHLCRSAETVVERVSKCMMPVLVVLSVIIAVYSMTRPGALEGVKYFLIPNREEFFLDDSRDCYGTDVLFALHCHGNPGYIRFLYEKGYFH